MYVCGKIQSALKEGCRKEEAIKIKCVHFLKKTIPINANSVQAC